MPEKKIELAVKRLKKGDKKAFREIYDAHYRQLYAMGRKYLKDAQLAEDAVQDIFIRLWLTREDLDPAKSIKSFLFTCLKNHVLNMIKSQKRRILLAYQTSDQKSNLTNCTEDDMIYAEYQGIVQKGLEKLPERRREIFRLKNFEGLSNSQIAETLSISVNTVKNHYYHGNKFLRGYLRERTGIRSV